MCKTCNNKWEREGGEGRGESAVQSGEWLICGVMDIGIVGEMGQSSAGAVGSGMGRP